MYCIFAELTGILCVNGVGIDMLYYSSSSLHLKYDIE